MEMSVPDLMDSIDTATFTPFPEGEGSDYFSFLSDESPAPLTAAYLDEDASSSSNLASPASSSPDLAAGVQYLPTFINPSELTTAPRTSAPLKESKKSSNRKRQRKDGPECNDVSEVQLSRDQLLTFTSEQLEDHLSRVSSVRAFTAAEEREIKRQRRLIKNRESAQHSRERKKAYVDELEAQVEKLKGTNGALNSAVSRLATENRQLSDEIQTLRRLLNRSNPSAFSALDARLAGLPADKVKTAGICMLLMMFSFGLFFNAPGSEPVALTNTHISASSQSSASSLVAMAGGAAGQSVAVRPTRSLMEAAEEHAASNQISTGRSVHSSQEPLAAIADVEVKREPASPRPQAKSEPVHKITVERQLDDGSRRPQRPAGNQTGASLPASEKAGKRQAEQKKRRFDDLEVTDTTDTNDVRTPPPPKSLHDFANESISANLSKLLTSADVQSNLITHGAWLDDSIKVRPNTVYFRVSEFRQLFPQKPTGEFDADAPFFLSFLVDASQLVDQKLLPPSTNPLIEILTQVVDVSIPQSVSAAFSGVPIIG